jgi:hypothetical protein
VGLFARACGNAGRVRFRLARDGAGHERGAVLERLRHEIGPLGAPPDLHELAERGEGRRRFRLQSLVDGDDGGVELAEAHVQTRDVDPEQRLPFGMRREVGARGERLAAKGGEVRLGGDALEKEPRIDVVGLCLCRALQRVTRRFEIVLLIFAVLGERHQRATRLVRRRGDLDQTIDELTEVLVRLPALDQRDEAF